MKTKKFIAARESELKNGDTKKVKVDDVDILLTKIDGEFYAVSPHCTHYGGPLHEGLLSGERIICPWHHAAFDVKTGKMLEPPAIDNIPCYETSVEDGKVFVTVNVDKHKTHEVPELKIPDPVKDDKIYVIIGSGAAANIAAQTLRQNGFDGRIVMISRDNRIPYDRPNLSKEYLQGEAEEEWMPLRSKEFYDKYKIELILGKRVKNVDTLNNQIVYEGGGSIKYHKVLFAAGAEPVELDIEGKSLENVKTLRTYDDTDDILNSLKPGMKIVNIGASFISLETAYHLSQRGYDITVVAPELVPFEKIFGVEVGTIFQELLEKNDIVFKLGKKPKKFTGEGKVETVELDNGEKIDADMVIVGVGVKPVTNLTGNIEPDKKGGYKVDKYMRLGDDDHYAAGDLARFNFWYTGEDIRIEHWRTAHQQGIAAAHNMAGKKFEYRSIPFFWTKQAGIALHYVGHAENWDEVIIDGDIDEHNFIAFYVKKGKIHAAAAVNRPREISAVEELMRLDKMPGADEIGNKDIMAFFKERIVNKGGSAKIE